MKLKPCPFCGKRDLYVTDRDEVIWIDCNQCGATVSFEFVIGHYDVESEVIRKWNRRASDERKNNIKPI